MKDVDIDDMLYAVEQWWCEVAGCDEEDGDLYELLKKAVYYFCPEQLRSFYNSKKN